MSEPKETTSQRLRRQAELALDKNRRNEAETLLERLLDIAQEEDIIFAHRHLAELRLERHPWRAALHLRHVLRARPDDDVPHALMGLAQALLGNFKVAVSCFRRALRFAPQMPWYLHNLGHLLDVALDQPEVALSPLLEAYASEPQHDEIVASLAHCKARVGELEGALMLAEDAIKLAPHNKDHQSLLRWIKSGAPKSMPAFSRSIQRTKRDENQQKGVQELFEQKMEEEGVCATRCRMASVLWQDFQEKKDVFRRRKEAYAAAIHYSIAMIYRTPGITQSNLARKYGITRSSLSRAYREIRTILALEPNDSRYYRT